MGSSTGARSPSVDPASARGRGASTRGDRVWDEQPAATTTTKTARTISIWRVPGRRSTARLKPAATLPLSTESIYAGWLRGWMCVLVIAAARPASAQSINVNFGDASNAPSPSYAAAGAAGTWNTVSGVAGPAWSLVAIDGSPTGVTVTQSPTATVLTGGDPSLSGDDAKLL